MFPTTLNLIWGADFRILSPTVFPRLLSGTDAADLLANIAEVPDPAMNHSEAGLA